LNQQTVYSRQKNKPNGGSKLKILDALKTAALFLIAAGLFVMSFVIYDVMNKHDRYAPVSNDDEQVVVMDTHTGQVWSAHYEAKETISLKIFNPIAGEMHVFPKRLRATTDE
jgi:heme/copper-type cytochrome/quinol oxidase subunit 2